MYTITRGIFIELKHIARDQPQVQHTQVQLTLTRRPRRGWRRFESGLGLDDPAPFLRGLRLARDTRAL
jgi:hypothetical protein